MSFISSLKNLILVLALTIALPAFAQKTDAQTAQPNDKQAAEQTKKETARDKKQPAQQAQAPDAKGQEKTAATTEEPQNRQAEADRDARQTVHTIVVKGEVFAEKESAYTINVIDRKKIEEKGISRSADLVGLVPGVNITEYNQGGVQNAIVIRGFQSGVHGGDMGVYLDGIPLNEYYGHGGGYAEPNVLIPMELDRVLVFKGPSSSLFGNFSRGGTLAYYTRQKEDYCQTAVKAGSFDTVDAQGALGVNITDGLWNNTALQIYRTKGFAENSEHIYGNASTRFTYDYKNFEVSFAFRAHVSDWDSPGYLTRKQWNSDDCFKQDPNIDDEDGGWRRQFSEKLDLSYAFTDNLKLFAWAFMLHSDWKRWSDFDYSQYAGQTEVNHHFYKAGTGTNINYKSKLVSFIGGFEFFRDATNYKKYDTVNRVRQAKTQSIDTTLDNYAFFGEIEVKPWRFFRPFVGVRCDMYTGTEENNITDYESDFTPEDYWHISPKAGIRSTVVENIFDLRVNVSNGYILPPAEALHNDTGKHFKPAEIWQYELGATVMYEKYLTFDVAGYLLDTTNEVQEKPAGSGEYANVGDTRRAGMEIDCTVVPVKYVEISGGFGYVYTRILKNGDDSVEHKHLTGVPETMAKAGLKFNLPLGFEVFTNYTHIGKSYTSGDNKETYKGYNLVDLGAAYRFRGAKEVSLTFEVRNLGNSHYATMSDGLWSTGAPRSFWGLVSIKW